MVNSLETESRNGRHGEVGAAMAQILQCCGWQTVGCIEPWVPPCQQGFTLKQAGATRTRPHVRLCDSCVCVVCPTYYILAPISLRTVRWMFDTPAGVT